MQMPGHRPCTIQFERNQKNYVRIQLALAMKHVCVCVCEWGRKKNSIQFRSIHTLCMQQYLYYLRDCVGSLGLLHLPGRCCYFRYYANLFSFKCNVFKIAVPYARTNACRPTLWGSLTPSLTPSAQLRPALGIECTCAARAPITATFSRNYLFLCGFHCIYPSHVCDLLCILWMLKVSYTF